MEPSIHNTNTRQRILRHLAFWLCYYLLYVKSDSTGNNNMQVSVLHASKFCLQIAGAYFLIYAIIPITLDKKRYAAFAISALAWAYMVYSVYTVIGYFYPQIDPLPTPAAASASLSQRLLSIPDWLDYTAFMFTPAAVMGFIRFYRNRQRLAKIEEEKKTLELKLLRSQLNPHFLFNTLDTLYAFALTQDERAPQLITRLSDILDYTLYGTNSEFVSLDKEIILLENYISLETLRHKDQRLRIQFNKPLHSEGKIPPFILSTLLEHAFEQGSTKESGDTILINLETTDRTIYFNLECASSLNSEIHNNFISTLSRIGSQLSRMYGKSHTLAFTNIHERFNVKLELNEI